MPDERPVDAPASLYALHEEVDTAAARIATEHGARLQCRVGCSGCCVDDLTVFEVEARRIRTRRADLLRTAAPHPPGACAFLGTDGACRIYFDRPYVCRTQGLPLRWTDETEDGEWVELRDICELNVPGPPIEELPATRCWTLGPFEERLRSVQLESDGELRRVSLRSLFDRSADGNES